MVKLLHWCTRLRKVIKARIISRGGVQDRSIRRHQKRLSSGAAMRIPCSGPILGGATGSVLMEIATNPEGSKDLDPLLMEIVPLLGIKCDVCVLSEEDQVFRLLDAILESNLWPLHLHDVNQVHDEENLDIIEEATTQEEGLEEVVIMTEQHSVPNHSTRKRAK